MIFKVPPNPYHSMILLFYEISAITAQLPYTHNQMDSLPFCTFFFLFHICQLYQRSKCKM